MRVEPLPPWAGRDTLQVMTAAATKVPFSDASLAEIREAIVPEDRDQFDASLRRALDSVASTLTLDPLNDFLAHWRRLAWSQTAEGHDAWRAMLARAEYIKQHGKRPPEPGETDFTEQDMMELIRSRLAAAR